MTTIHHPRGVSLVELLVSVMFLGLFTLVVHQFSRSMLRGVRVLEVASETQEAARIGIQLIVRDVRDAGFSPHGSVRVGVCLARRDAITVVKDLNGDGDTDDRNEIVGYSLDAARQALMRLMGNAAPQPMLSDLAPDGLTLAYFASDGTVIPVGSGALDADDRERIRRIDVRLTVEMGHPDPAYVTPIRRIERASIALRNCRGSG